MPPAAARARERAAGGGTHASLLVIWFLLCCFAIESLRTQLLRYSTTNKPYAQKRSVSAAASSTLPRTGSGWRQALTTPLREPPTPTWDRLRVVGGVRGVLRFAAPALGSAMARARGGGARVRARQRRAARAPGVFRFASPART